MTLILWSEAFANGARVIPFVLSLLFGIVRVALFINGKTLKTDAEMACLRVRYDVEKSTNCYLYCAGPVFWPLLFL